MTSHPLSPFSRRLAALVCFLLLGLLIGQARLRLYAQQPVTVTIAPARGGDVAIETDVLVVTNLTGFDGNTAGYTYQWYRSADQAAGNYQPSQDNDAGTGPNRYNLDANGSNDVGHRFYVQVTDGSGNTASSNVFAVGPRNAPRLLHPAANDEIRVNQVYFNIENVAHDGHTPPNPAGSYTYEIQVASDNAFANIVASNANVAETTSNNNITYWQSGAVNGALFWRARAKVADAPGNWSTPVAFTIANVWSADGNTWHWPLDNAGIRVSGTFAEGYYHHGYLGTQLHGGIDLSGADGCGDDVRAARSGQIVAPVGSGSAITLDHLDLKSSYLHMANRTALPRGTFVNQGFTLGVMGTVATSQCHLHFDVLARNNATYYNPLAYVSWNDAATPVVPHSYLRSDRLLSSNATGIAGTTYIIAETRDQEGGNRLAPYRVQFSVNGTEVRNIQFDSFTSADNETNFYGYQTAARGANPPYLLYAEWDTSALAEDAGPQTIRMVSHDYNGHNANREMVIGPEMTASPASVTIDRCRPEQKTVTLTINNRNNNIEGQTSDTYQLTLQPGGVSASLSQNTLTVNNGASGTVTLRISGTTGGTVRVIAASGIVTDVKDAVDVSVSVIDGPGCDHSDDNHSAASPQILAPVPLSEEPTRVAVLLNGFAPDASGFINALQEPNTLVDTDFSPDIVTEYPVLVIPSGGLYGLENSEFFRARLEEYASRGGTILVFDQQRGDDYSVLPGGGLNGYGWSQDNSCSLSSLYIRNYDQVLSGFSDAILNSNVDGYFTDLPADSDVLLWRAKNGQPAMVRYDFGAGAVIATTAYDDWGVSNWQTTSDAYILNRDLLAWAVDPALLPEYDPSQPISLPVVVSNASATDAAAVQLTLLSPGKNVVSQSIEPLDLPAGTSATLTYTGTATTPLGIWRVDYALLDGGGQEIQARQPGERFVVKNPSPLSQPLKEVAFSVNAPTERFIAGTNGEFTFTLFNNSDITRTLQVRYGLPHHTWETGDRATYGNFSELSRTVDVGPHSQSQFIHVFPMRTNDRLFAYLYENGVQKDQTWFQTRKASAVASTVVAAAQAEYARGQSVSITSSVTNLADLPVNFSLRLHVAAPDNSVLYSEERPVSLTAGVTQDELFSFTIPVSATNGTYRIQADLYQETLLVSGGVSAFTLPNSPATFGVALPASLPVTAADPLRIVVNNPHAYLSVNGNLGAMVTDPAGVTTTLPVQTYDLNAGSDTTLTFDLTGLPARYGTYRFDFIAADQYSERAWTETRQVAIATNLVFDQPSYKVRQTLGISLTMSNSDFNLTPLLTLTIPDLGYTEVQTLPFSAEQTAVLTYALSLPPSLGPGFHAVDVSLALTDVVTDSNRFLLPPSRVTAFAPQTDFLAGDVIPVELRNLGGVDAPVTATMTLVDQYNVLVAADSVTVTVLAGEVSTLTLPIPAGAASGLYYLDVNGQNLASGAAVQQQAGIHVDGVSASLLVQTGQPEYFSSDDIAAMAQILMNSGGLDGEDLSLRICSDNSSNGTADTSLPEPSYQSQTVPLDWIDIAAGGMVVAAANDTNTLVNIGFPFEFYGTSYTQMYVSSNGFISFGAGYTNSANGSIPSLSTPNNAIYALWDDLYPIGGANGTVFVQQIDATRTVVQWQQVTHCCSAGAPETFQVVLDGSDHSITLQYLDVTFPESATVGVEDVTGSRGVQIAYNQAGIISDNLAIKLNPGQEVVDQILYDAVNVPMEWVDIAADGMVVAAADNTSTLVNIGFPFQFYGTSYTQMYVNSNGYITFGSSINSSSNGAIPSVSTPNNAIYALWDDLYPIGGDYGNVYMQQISPTLTIVQWERVMHCCSTGSPETFQVLLDGSDHSITLQYLDVSYTGSATVGVENSNGTYAIQVAYNQDGVITDTLALRFAPQLETVPDISYNSAAVPIDWVDIAAEGMVVSTADNTSTLVNIGFPFEFYGASYTQMYVNSNGYLTFGSSYNSSSNGPIPSVGSPNNAIYALWDDLYPIGGDYGVIYVQQISPTLTVVQWERVAHCCSTGSPETFQVLLDGSDHSITLQYLDVSATNGATVGVENATGYYAIQVAYNQDGVITDGLALRFAPQPQAIADVVYNSAAVAFDWVDIAAGGTVVAGENDTASWVEIGFPFEFFGSTYTEMYVDSNRYITFDPPYYSNPYNEPLPTPNFPNNAIYALWDDLYPVGGDAGSVFVQQVGPTRTVVQWERVTHCCGAGTPETFQVVLDGSDNSVTLQYLEMTAPDYAVVGVENAAGNLAIQHTVTQTGVITDGVALQFLPTTQMVEQLNYDVAPETINWQDISATGAIVAEGDDTYSLFDIGFPFSFYGITYTELYVGSNGYVSFGAGYSEYYNEPIPSPYEPNNAIYGLWTDLYPAGGVYGNVYAEQVDATHTIIQWEQSAHCCSEGEPETFQIILDGSDNSITLQYLALTTPDYATVGVENADGTVAAQLADGSGGGGGPAAPLALLPSGVITDGAAFKLTPITETVTVTSYLMSSVPITWSEIAPPDGTNVVAMGSNTYTPVDLGFPFEF
ncbi:MAG: hypothetical protein Fur0021_32740 [Candidatus Promineifilaceae bacterium]